MARGALALLQGLLVLALAPGVVGLVRWLKARLQNRRGAPAWQPYFELRKLFGKEVVVSENASWLFRAAPYVVFVKDPPGTPQLVEIDPYSYAGVLRPGDQVTLRYWKDRVAEVLTPSGTIQTPDDPAIIAEDSSPASVLRSVGIGVGYCLLATAIVIAGRRWGAPLRRR